MTHSYIEDMAYIREELKVDFDLNYALEMFELQKADFLTKSRRKDLVHIRVVVGVIATIDNDIYYASELTGRDRTTIVYYFKRFRLALEGLDKELLEVILQSVKLASFDKYKYDIANKAQHLKKTFGKRLALQHLEEMFNFMNELDLPTIPIKQIEDLKLKINKL